MAHLPKMKHLRTIQRELLGFSAPNGVHRLVHKVTNERVGYSIVGATQGPRALAVGGLKDVESSFDRIAALESIVQMRGHLILVSEGAIFDVTSGLTVDHLYCEPFDGSIFLATGRSGLAETAIEAKLHREAYWSVLRLCKSLGMIAGRGVPISPHRNAKRFIRAKRSLS